MIPKNRSVLVAFLLASALLGSLSVGQTPNPVTPTPPNDPGPPPPVIVCRGCDLAVDANVQYLPAHVTVSIDWGASVSGACLPSGGSCAGNPCSLTGFVLKMSSDANAPDYWVLTDGWSLLPRGGSLTVSPDDGPLPCGHGYLWTFRTKRDKAQNIEGRIFLTCSDCQ